MNILDVLFKQHPVYSFERKAERLFRRFPHLPIQLVEFLVSLLPGIFFALGILNAVIGALILMSNSRILNTLSIGSSSVNPLYLMINGMLAVSNGIFMLLAFPEIKRESLTGWQTLFLINLISILQSILSILFSPAAFLSVALYILVTFYVTYELKPYFKEKD